MSRIALAIAVLSGLLASCAGPQKLLPHTLYYLEGPREHFQVWRLEADGLTKVQITREEAGVQEFAVSPADGSLAFVSNNQLFLVDGHGENRRLIADGSQSGVWRGDPKIPLKPSGVGVMPERRYE